MNEPTEIKYPLDENGEPYFAATHIKAVKGLEFDNDEDFKTIIVDLQSKNSELESNLKIQNETITDLISRIENLENKTPTDETVETDKEGDN